MLLSFSWTFWRIGWSIVNYTETFVGQGGTLPITQTVDVFCQMIWGISEAFYEDSRDG